MTRRVFVTGCLPVLLEGQQVFDSGDTHIIFVGDSDEFGIGVRSPIKSDWIRVEVFYEVVSNSFDSIRGYATLLLSKESLAPGQAGQEAWGTTNQNFHIPRKQIKYVQLTFLFAAGPQRKITV